MEVLVCVFICSLIAALSLIKSDVLTYRNDSVLTYEAFFFPFLLNLMFCSSTFFFCSIFEDARTTSVKPWSLETTAQRTLQCFFIAKGSVLVLYYGIKKKKNL